MVIRKLEIEDIEPLSQLYYQFWNEKCDIEKMKNKFVQLQDMSAYIFLCATEDKELLGSVMGIVCEELYGSCKPFLVVENMVVDRRSRKKGVGRMLFAELERQAKAKNCTQIILVTEADRNDACAFYESLGFHPTENKGYKKKI